MLEIRTSQKLWTPWKKLDAGDGKVRKVPMVPVNKPQDAILYADALAMVGKGWDGVGYVFAEGCGYVGIDIDGCLASAGLAEGAASALRTLFEGYRMPPVQDSPSGKGIHIVMPGSLPGVTRKVIEYAGQRMEIFADSCFMTQCGDPEDAQEAPLAIGRLLEVIQAAKRPATGLESAQNRILPGDEAIVGKLESGKAADLWHGIWSAPKYPTQSEADCALMAHILFYTRDEDQAIRIFRQSALAKTLGRKKTGEADYLKRTCQSAAIIQRGSADAAVPMSVVPAFKVRKNGKAYGLLVPAAVFGGPDGLPIWINVPQSIATVHDVAGTEVKAIRMESWKYNEIRSDKGGVLSEAVAKSREHYQSNQ